MLFGKIKKNFSRRKLKLTSKLCTSQTCLKPFAFIICVVNVIHTKFSLHKMFELPNATRPKSSKTGHRKG